MAETRIPDWFDLGKRRRLYEVGFLLLLVYLSFPSQMFGYDSSWYAYSIKNGVELFHPHHLLYNFLGHKIYVVVSKLAPIAAMPLMSALGGVLTAASVLLIGMITRRLTGRDWLALAVATLYGCCYAPMYVATAVEVYAGNIFLDLLAVWLLLRYPASSIATAALLGLLSGLAALFHQTAIFFSLALIYLLWRLGWSLSAQLTQATVAAVSCGVPYLLVAKHLGCSTPEAFARFLVAYAQSPEFAAGNWGHGLALHKLPQALLGAATTLAAPRLEYLQPLLHPGQFRHGFAFANALLLLLALLVVAALLIKAVVRLATGQRRRAAAHPIEAGLWLWVFLHCAFTLWWNSDNLEFWLMAVAPLCILVACVASRRRSLPLSMREAILFIGLLGGLNLGWRVIPDSQRRASPVAHIMEAIGCQGFADGDWIIGPVNDIEPYTRYRCGARLAHHSLFYTFYDTPAQREAVYRQYGEELARAVRERQVYLQEGELDPETTHMTGGWSGAEFRAAYKGYLASAIVVGTYQHEGRSWRIFKLR